VHFVDSVNPENFRKAITSNTKAVSTESLVNPGGVICDIEQIKISQNFWQNGLHHVLSCGWFTWSWPMHVAGECLSVFKRRRNTLLLRMQKHADNVLGVAKWLQCHSQVSWVSYAGLPDSEFYSLAQKYRPKGAGSVFTLCC